MRIDIDLDDCLMLSVPGSKDPISRLKFKRSTTANIQVRFWRSGVVVELDDESATGAFGIKPDGQFDTAPLVYCAAWTKTGTGSAAVYTFASDFNSQELSDLMGALDNATANDKATILAMTEIRWMENGLVYRTQSVPTIIENNIIGDEYTPLIQPTPDQWLELRRPAPLVRSLAPLDYAIAHVHIGTSNAEMIYTAVNAGSAGNNISVAQAAPAASAAVTAVAVVATAITVTPGSLARMTMGAGPPDNDGRILSTLDGITWTSPNPNGSLRTEISGHSGAWTYHHHTIAYGPYNATSAAAVASPDLIPSNSWSGGLTPSCTALASSAAQNAAAVNAYAAAAALVTAVAGGDGSAAILTQEATSLAGGFTGTPGLLGQEAIVSQQDVYKCTHVNPVIWVKLN